MPPSTIRSSFRSTSVWPGWSRTPPTAFGRPSGGTLSGRPATIVTASVSRRPSRLALSSARRSRDVLVLDRDSGRSTIRCSTRPVSVISTSISRVRRQPDQLDVPDRRPGQRRVLHDRDLAGQLREQPHGAHHHVVEVDGAVQEVWMARRSAARQRLDVRQPVDEQAVALVGRHPARAGVRLGDVALAPRAPPCRCGWSPATRRGCADRRGPWTPPARGWTRSPRRWRGARQASARPARVHLPWHSSFLSAKSIVPCAPLRL